MGKLYFSHRLDLLAKKLAEELIFREKTPLSSPLILVPHGALKQWLFIQLSAYSPEKGVAGYRILTLKEALAFLLPADNLPSGYAELFLSIYSELPSVHSKELQAYLGKHPHRDVELSDYLAHLFLQYGHYGKGYEAKEEGWQEALFQRLFMEKGLKLPREILSQKTPRFAEPIYCFGLDFLPPLFWTFLHRFSSLSIYLFSPCFHYWDDLCTDRERKGWNRYWKKKGMSEKLREEWQDHWLDAPPLLANWGKIGRETIKILDRFDGEIEEDYSPYPSLRDSSLARVQSRLLEFVKKDPELLFEEDGSIRIFLSGSSRLREIENLRDVILKSMKEERLIPSEIGVFAPDIEPYVPLIEFVFTDLPYRIFGAAVGSKSFFLQGLFHLLALIESPWETEDLMTLFEIPSFFKKHRWDSEKIEQFREWLSEISLDESGLEQLMSRFFYLGPEIKNTIEISDADALEELIAIFVSLQRDFLVFREQKMKASLWAEILQKLVDQYLFCDLQEEADLAAWSFFQRLLSELRAYAGDFDFPFAAIQKLLQHKLQGQIHSSHLHGIRFSSLAPGSITPHALIILIGMDEESFPRYKLPSSLDLLRKEKVYVPDGSDEDRYLFLQILFAAQRALFISYRHLSEEEGKPISPSFLVQELLGSLDAPVESQTVSYETFSSSAPPSPLPWPDTYEKQLPEGDFVISLSDLSLLARHPWKFYLQKKWGIYLEEEQNESFSLCKAKMLRSSLTELKEEGFPLGVCGEALKQEVRKKIETREELLVAWGIRKKPLFSLILREGCREKRWLDETRLEMPAYEIALTDQLQVRLVGEIKNLSVEGMLHLGDDALSGLLKNWPEYLMACCTLSLSQIFFLKSGKVKKIENAEAHLKAFIPYYFYSLSAPSPLLNAWAETLLLKGEEELEKKISQTISGKEARFEDPTFDWVISRAKIPSATQILGNWSAVLKQTCQGLIAMYPGRGKNERI
jgi:exonuclease V gamma subunit